MREAFEWPAGEGPHGYQEEIARNLVQYGRESVRSGHGSGKTASAAQIVVWFRVTRDGASDGGDWKVVTTASAWRQLEHYLWPEIHKWVRRLRPELRANVERGAQVLGLKGQTGEAFAVASNEPSLIEGAHAKYLLYVFDEAKAIPDETYNAAEGAFTGGGIGSEVYFLMISTPGGPSGRFYDIQRRRAGYEDWKAIHVTAEQLIEAKRMTVEWREQRRRQWGETSAVYQNRVEGNFAEEDEDVVIPLAWIEAAIERWRVLERTGALPTTRTHFGMDVGRGGDKTTLAERADDVIVEIGESRRADVMAAAGLLVQKLNAHPEAARALVDIIGIGAGAFDRAREQVGDRVAGFNAATAAVHPLTKKPLTGADGKLQFANLRAAAWWGLRERLDPATDSQVALPPDDELIGDLAAPKWVLTSGGKVKVEAKDEIIARIGRSPDKGDGVVHAFASELVMPARPPMVFF